MKIKMTNINNNKINNLLIKILIKIKILKKNFFNFLQNLQVIKNKLKVYKINNKFLEKFS